MPRNPPGAEEYFTGCRTVKKFSGLTSDPEIELVIVNTPDQTHYDYTKEALEAGKHGIVEKPFTITVAEGEELVALAEKKGLIISVFHNLRWDGGALTDRDDRQRTSLNFSTL